MKNKPIKYYQVESTSQKGRTILGEMIQFAQERNIGLVGRGINALSYGNEKAVYFSYFPGQINHPSVTEKSEEELVAEFERRLDQSGLQWKTFDLGKLLENIIAKTIILSTESSRTTTNSSFNTEEDIEAITRETLGEDAEVIYEFNIRNCAELIRRREVSGIVIPGGHGDHSAVRNLENHLGKISIPIFNAYQLSYSVISKEYRAWLKENFTKR
jgi:hypothetical protein